MSTREKVFLLFPGPKYDVHHELGVRLKGLSKQFGGAALTATPQSITIRFGRFILVTTRIVGTGGLRYTLAYFLKAILLALRWRNKKKHVALVITYDPLKTGLLGLIVARILKAKLVTEINGDYAAWANYADMKYRRLRAWKRAAYVSIEKFVVRKADGIKLLYPTQLDFLKPVTQKKIVRTFANLVDLTPFQDLGERKVVLIAGFPFYLKGVDILIRAFRKVAPDRPDWKLKILGWFPDTQLLDAHIRGHPQIFHHPPVEHREMPEHIGKCGIFVLPSRTEGMGRVLLEAMAAGKPRIGAKVGGIPMVIEHGVDGYLFEPEDVDTLSRLLHQLMSDAELRKAIGQAGRRRAERDFTTERYLQNTFSFYEEVIRGSDSSEHCAQHIKRR